MNEFAQYLAFHEIDPVTLSINAHVRYLTAWNAQQGNPITLANAQKIKQALVKMTGVPYTGSFVILGREPFNQLPMLPIKKLPRPHYF